MPELPEAEAMRNTIASSVRDNGIVDVWCAKNFDDIKIADLKNCRHRKVIDVVRHGKVLSLLLTGNLRIVFKLGMSGRLILRKSLERHDRVAFLFEDKTALVFNDFRRFGRIILLHSEELALSLGLGPDALTDSFDPESLPFMSGRPIKSILLDQGIVAGLGNIYTCESLFRARIDPRRSVKSLDAQEKVELIRAIKSILHEAVQRGGSTLSDYRGTEGEAGDFDKVFCVYGRSGQPCPGCECSTGVIRLVQNGRSTYFCPFKQK